MTSRTFHRLTLPAAFLTLRLLPADVAARLAQRDQQDIAHKRKMTGRREGTVLDPCRLALEFKLADLGSGGGKADLLSGHLWFSGVGKQMLPPGSRVQAGRPGQQQWRWG